MGLDWFPLWLSLRVAAISTALALIIGRWLAWLMAKRGVRCREILDAAETLPLGPPRTVLGYSLRAVCRQDSPVGHL